MNDEVVLCSASIPLNGFNVQTVMENGGSDPSLKLRNWQYIIKTFLGHASFELVQMSLSNI